MVWPPYALTTARHLFLSEKMSFLHTSRGIASQSSMSAWARPVTEKNDGRLGRFLILQVHPKGALLVSGLETLKANEEQGCPCWWDGLSSHACGLALSSTNTRFYFRMNRGQPQGWWPVQGTGSAFNEPSMLIRSDFSCRSIAPHTITLPHCGLAPWYSCHWSLMICWRNNSGNPERVSSVFTFVSVWLCSCARGLLRYWSQFF